MKINQGAIQVRKASGEVEEFDVEKLKKSLYNAGANQKLIDSIVNIVLSKLYPGITTKEIYQIAFARLKKENHKSHITYKLKNALYNLGESGFAFEKLIKAVYKKLNYEVQLDVLLPGKCVHHEVDVVAENENEIILIECKYSENRKKMIGIQTPLYVVARMKDIIENWGKFKTKPIKKMVVTNSKLSADSIRYAQCEDLENIAWNSFGSIQISKLIEMHHIYPISIIPSLSKKQLNQFFEIGIITCEDLFKNREKIEIEAILGRNKRQIIKEIEQIIHD
jgi:Holliday junction resolvase